MLKIKQVKKEINGYLGEIKSTNMMIKIFVRKDRFVEKITPYAISKANNDVKKGNSLFKPFKHN